MPAARAEALTLAARAAFQAKVDHLDGLHGTIPEEEYDALIDDAVKLLRTDSETFFEAWAILNAFKGSRPWPMTVRSAGQHDG